VHVDSRLHCSDIAISTMARRAEMAKKAKKAAKKKAKRKAARKKK
jgi:hypothetical protein